MSGGTMKKGFLCVIAFILSLNMTLISFADTWHADGNGWWYGDENSYYVNTWAIIEDDSKIGRLYCFDENGYLRTEQITPDGYYVGLDGSLFVDNRSLEVCDFMSGNRPTENDWKSGDAYCKSWISLRLKYPQRQFSKSPKNSSTLKGEPFGIRIYRDVNGKMYAESYDLKGGIKTIISTYEFKYYKDEKYVINTGSGREMFYPGTFCPLESYPTVVRGTNELKTETIKYEYFFENEK